MMVGYLEAGFSCDLYEETSVDLSNRISDEIYYRIENGDGSLVWSGDKSRYFCLSNDAHYYYREMPLVTTRKVYGKHNGSGCLEPYLQLDITRFRRGESSECYRT